MQFKYQTSKNHILNRMHVVFSLKTFSIFSTIYIYIYIYIHRHVFHPAQESSMWLRITSREQLMFSECSKHIQYIYIRKDRQRDRYTYRYIHKYVYRPDFQHQTSDNVHQKMIELCPTKFTLQRTQLRGVKLKEKTLSYRQLKTHSEFNNAQAFPALVFLFMSILIENY